MLALFASWFLSNLKKLKKKRQNMSLGAIVFVIVLAGGIFLSNSPLAGIFGLLKIAEFSLLAIYTSKKIEDLKLLLIPLCFGIFFESSLAIAQHLNGGSLSGILYFFGERYFNSQTPGIANASVGGNLILRPYATFSHPNVLAGFLFIGMTIVLLLSSISKFFKTFILGIGTVALILTFSRIAIAGWALLFFGKLFMEKRKNIFFLLGIAVFLILLLSPLGLRFAGISLSEESVQERIILSKAAFQMFLDKPLLGVGVNNFLTNLPFYEKPSGLIFYLQPVHNIFLLILSQTGILGFGFFVWFLIKTLKRFLGNNKLKKSLIVLFLEVMLLGFFDHYFLTLQQGQMLFALIIGLCWSDTIA